MQSYASGDIDCQMWAHCSHLALPFLYIEIFVLTFRINDFVKCIFFFQGRILQCRYLIFTNLHNTLVFVTWNTLYHFNQCKSNPVSTFSATKKVKQCIGLPGHKSQVKYHETRLAFRNCMNPFPSTSPTVLVLNLVTVKYWALKSTPPIQTLYGEVSSDLVHSKRTFVH